MSEGIPIPESKYIVFDREEWFSKIQDELGAKKLQQISATYEVRDGVVIRGQDVFAASTFFGYSNAIQTAMEILMGSFEEISPELGHVLESMSDTADHFHELGVWASQVDAHIPD